MEDVVCSYMYMYSMQKLCWLNGTTKCVVVTFTNQILFTWWYSWLWANICLEQMIYKLASQAHFDLVHNLLLFGRGGTLCSTV